MGRFISPDTIIPEPTNPQTLNRYSYCVNNPLKYNDPSGRDQVIVTNNDGTFTIMDGDGKSLAKANDIDDLAQKMKDCETKSRQVDLPLQPKAAAFFDTIAEEKAGQILFDIYGQINSTPNTILGLILGGLSGGTPRSGPGGTVIYENVNSNSFTGKLMSSIKGNPVTFGYVILTTDLKMSLSDEKHELGHVTQSAILGSAYLSAYGIAWFAAGGWWKDPGVVWNNNVMEVGPLHPTWPRR